MVLKKDFRPVFCFSAKRKNGCFSVIPAGTISVMREREREIYFQVKHINMDIDMMCQLIQMARLDGDAMIINDLLPATP